MSNTFPKVLLILIALLAIAAGIYKTSPHREDTTIGGPPDSHGCIWDGGYIWCSAHQACERPWEKYCTNATPKIVSFSCDGRKKITATFYPADDKFVDLVLSEGVALSLPHAQSGSGARYANSDESFVFWNKGNTAFIMEKGTTTYSGCVS